MIMAYDKTNKKLSVATGSGITPWEIAQCLDDYRVNSKGQRDVGMLCSSPKIVLGARFKPVRHSTLVFITEEQRKSVNWGMLMKEMISIRKNYILAYDNTQLGTSFASDNPERWECLLPRGGSYNEWFRMADFDGYNHKAAAPMSVTSSSVDANINNPMLNINAKISIESQVNLGNYADIEIMLKELNVTPSFGINDSTYTNIVGGYWRMGVAIQVPQSDGKYRYLILSTINPIAIFSSNISTEDFRKYNIDMAEPNFQSRLKKIARYNGISSFKAIPFLGCDLKYDAAKGWYWGGTTYERAITFPNADTFTMNISGFTTKIVSAISGWSIKVNGNALAVASATISGVVLSIPRSLATQATSLAIEMKFKLSTAFGLFSGIKGGVMSESTPATLTGSAVSGSASAGWAIDARTEWENTDKEYSLTLGDTNLMSAIKATASIASNSALSLNQPLKLIAANSDVSGTITLAGVQIISIVFS